MSDFFYSLEQDLSGFLYTVNQNLTKLSTQSYGILYNWVSSSNSIDSKEAAIAESQQQLRESEKCVGCLLFTCFMCLS